MSSKQIHRGRLETAQSRVSLGNSMSARVLDLTVRLASERTANRLRSLWLGMTRALPSRPEPRGRFDEVARDGSTYTPWNYVREPALACALAARPLGAEARRETKRAIHELFDALLAEVDAVLPDDEDLELLREIVAETDVESLAHPIELQVAVHPTLPTLCAARPVLAQQQRQLGRLIASIDRATITAEQQSSSSVTHHR